jgi:CHAP domain
LIARLRGRLPDQVSFSDVVGRVSALQALAQRALVPVDPPHRIASAPAGGRLGFDEVLAEALRPSETSTQGTGVSAGARTLAAATGELGIAEEPPGSNDGARIADYRSAVAGSYAGAPWCAYFVSWAAQQAGAAIGDAGQGLGSVEEIAAWAGRTGRLLPAGAVPSPGDLILFGGRHVGLVESINADGSLTTIEGNERDAVRRVTRAASEATGFVRL